MTDTPEAKKPRRFPFGPSLGPTKSHAHSRDTVRTRFGQASIRATREHLIEALAAASPSKSEKAAMAIVDALDTYLAEDPNDRAPTLFTFKHEAENLREERDAALARAEKAEALLARAPSRPSKKKKKVR